MPADESGIEPWAGEPEDEPTPDWQDVPDGHKAGYVAVIGRPNVGKSSLVNILIGEPLAPTSPVPQTTRRRLLGILSLDLAQAVFVDTPGIHQPRQPLGKMMVRAADQALIDADLVLCVVDCSREPGEEDQLAVQRAQQAAAPAFLVINKLDLCPDGGFRAGFEALLPEVPHYGTSATAGTGVPELLEAVLAALPENPPFFPPDQVTDVFEREVGAELIREAALLLLQQELPHAVAVKVEDWKERPNGMIYLSALVIVERESQKGIVIGKGGRMLKTIGTLAREKLENWLGQRVYLDLRVKVYRNWRKDENTLRWLGFAGE